MNTKPDTYEAAYDEIVERYSARINGAEAWRPYGGETWYAKELDAIEWEFQRDWLVARIEFGMEG